MDVIASETARMPIEKCQRALTQKANAQELVREAGGLLERLQRGVALEALGESGGSLGAEEVG